MPRRQPSRREVLAAGVGGLAGLAGCRNGSPAADANSPPSDGTSPDSTGDETDHSLDDGELWEKVLRDPQNSSRTPADVGPEQTPEVQWRADVLPELPYPPIVRGDLLYATAHESSTLYALAVGSGEEQWTRSFDSDSVYAASHRGTLYAFSSNSVQALDPADGGQQWRLTVDVDRPGIIMPTDEHVFVNALNTDGRDLVAAANPDGEGFEWENRFEWGITGFGVGTDRLYVVAHDPIGVIALNRSTGEERWRHRFEFDSQQIYLPTVDDDQVYVGGLHFEHLYALDAASGAERWRTELQAPTGVALNGETLIVGGASTLRSVDRADGSSVWQRELEGTLTLGPTVTPTRVYAGEYIEPDGDLDGSPVHAIDPQTGDTIWQLQLDDALWRTPIPTSHGLFTGLRDGTILCLDD